MSQVALFLDFENLVLAFERRGKAKSRRLAVAAMVEFLEESFGQVTFRRAYADWSSPRFSEYQRELQNLGIEMLHVCRRTASSKKNGADILLTTDAVECLLLRPFIDTFALVSGDSDIGPLVTKLKSHGKTVVVIGPDERSTARHVIELADRFKYFRDIGGGQEGESSGEGRAKRPRRSRRKASPQAAVVSILEGAGQPVESASLKRALLSRPGLKTFQEKALGFKTWSAFLRSIDGVELLRKPDLSIEVTLSAGRKK